MSAHQLVILLQKLSFPELKQYKKLVKDNAHGKTYTILEAVIEIVYQPEQDVSFKQLIEKIYKKKATDKLEKELRNYLSKLNQLLEEYLLLNRIKKDQRWYYYLLTEEVLDRGAQQLFQRQINKASTHIDNFAYGGQEQSFLEWKTSEMAYFHPSTSKTNGHSTDFDQVYQRFRYFAAITQFRYFLEMRFRKLVTQQTTPLPEEVAALVEQLTAQPSPLGRFYLQLWQSLQVPASEQTVRSLWTDYQQLVRQIASNERLILFGFMINSVSRLTKLGDERGYAIALEVYKHGLQTGILTTSGYLTGTQFCAISYLAGTYQQIAWAKEFISKYQHLLLYEERKVIVQLALAEVDFFEEAYLAALKKTKAIKMGRDVNFKIRKRSLQLRCLVELQQDPEQEALLNDDYDFADLSRNFKQFVERSNQISEINRESCLNFIHLTSMIYHAQPGEQSKEELLQLIAQYDAVFSKTWLVKKIETNKKLS
jgi:hypothetical protein